MNYEIKGKISIVTTYLLLLYLSNSIEIVRISQHISNILQLQLPLRYFFLLGLATFQLNTISGSTTHEFLFFLYRYYHLAIVYLVNLIKADNIIAACFSPYRKKVICFVGAWLLKGRFFKNQLQGAQFVSFVNETAKYLAILQFQFGHLN